ncbi:MAG: RDD family protein [Pyrinomonadaceae bacterium]|nr:RDD family protein [Pyrinomonadaceae bacterium]
MVNDTVREELETKIARGSGQLRNNSAAAAAPAAEPIKAEMPVREPLVSGPLPKPAMPAAAPVKAEAEPPAPAPARSFTSHLPPKKTSPTLVGFQPKNTSVPDWRLQVQNAVRQRATGGVKETSGEAQAPALQRTTPTHGATALKTEPVSAPAPATHSNDKVAAALRRIEESRRAFLPEEAKAPAAKPAAARSYPFNVVTRNEAPVRESIPAPAAAASASAKPKLVSSLRIEKKAYDTNKLPPIPQPAKISSSFEIAATARPEPRKVPNPFLNEPFLGDELEPIEGSIHETQVEEPAEPTGAYEIEEIDDLPSFSTRFAAGAFDFILSSAATLIILSPFMVGGSTWLSLSGVLAFAATLAILLFLYTTASLTWWGKTFGMRIFSMELIDIEENHYPSVHQAAVSSAVYVLSIAFGGAGFLTVPFNEERRAVHDIVSGTLLVREI